jgi:serine/threonine protein kinase
MAAPTGSAPAAPEVFGRYPVRRVLGSGGFGAVYLGHDTRLDRPVAIKVLHPATGRPAADADQFLQ